MAVRRLSAGQTITHVNAEVIGVLALGGIIVLTMPFSIWPSGSLTVFSDIYVKVILIFALMISTITSPRRVRQLTWIMIVASGYIAAAPSSTTSRGVNLVEGDRVRGAVGGMFENPNDLALNLVTFLAPTLFIIVQERKTSRRLFAGAIAMAMLAAIVCTKSRSGFLGLAGMIAVVLYYVAKAEAGPGDGCAARGADGAAGDAVVLLGSHGQHRERRRRSDRLARCAPAAHRPGHRKCSSRTRSPASAPASSGTTTRRAWSSNGA